MILYENLLNSQYAEFLGTASDVNAAVGAIYQKNLAALTLNFRTTSAPNLNPPRTNLTS